jgi:DNA polymerase I-like protein with 3'-5' exonuclease and polymerase domains
MKIKFRNQDFDVKSWTAAQGAIGRLIAIDTETEKALPGVVPRYVLGQAYAGGSVVYLLQREHLEPFFHIHAASTLVMHNAPFDIFAIERASAVKFDPFIEENRLWDTGLLYQLHGLATLGYVPHRWGLAAVAEELLGLELSKEEEVRTGFGHSIKEDGSIDYSSMTHEELEYAAKDAIVTGMIFSDLFRKVRSLDPKQQLSHGVQLKGAIGLHAIELNGIGMDLTRRADVMAALDTGIDHHLNALAAYGYIPGKKGINKILQNHLAELEESLEVSFPKTWRSEAIATRHRVLEPFRDASPFIAHLLDYRELKKTRDFVAELDQPRVHPHFNVLLNTGRTSCHDPNLQNMPRAAGIRECFAPAPGHKLVIIDYAQIELSTLAQICIDRYGFSKMAELINQQVDLHRWFASVLLKKPIEAVTKEERQRAKACNFGFPGGLGVNAFLHYAKAVYGIEEMTRELAEFYRSEWVRAFPEMHHYLADDTLARLKSRYDFSSACQHLGFQIDSDTAAKMFIRILSGNTANTAGVPYTPKTLAWAFDEVLVSIHPASRGIREGSFELYREVLGRTAVTTRTGRIRADCEYTAARNTPFQGLAADGAKIALYMLYKAGFKVVNFIHDEFLVEIADLAHIEDEAKEVERIVVAGMRSVVPDVAVRTEWFIADRWKK